MGFIGSTSTALPRGDAAEAEVVAALYVHKLARE